MESDLTSNILMVRPVKFAFNPETSVNNSFQLQNLPNAEEARFYQTESRYEFDTFVGLLASEGIRVVVIEDTASPLTPDSIYPNNWISTHPGGVICLFSMFAPNRRLERSKTVLNSLTKKFIIKKTVDISHLESYGIFLEGTGSLVLDRTNLIAYAAISPRTHPEAVASFCESFGYKAVTFVANGSNDEIIYHTNVVMSMGRNHVVICLASIRDAKARENVKREIEMSGKTVIDISLVQMNNFAGNSLQVMNKKGEILIVMSNTAYNSLTKDQVEMIEKDGRIVKGKLDTIEKVGGGSARCMMAELFLKEIKWF